MFVRRINDFFEFLLLCSVLVAMTMAMRVDRIGELAFPFWTRIRRRFLPDSPFFASGNVERELLAKQYECLVEGCGLKFKNYKARHRHLIDKHKFPTTFEFFKTTQPSMKRREKLKRQHVPKLKHEEDKVEASLDTMEVDDKASVDSLVSALSTLTTTDTTPSNVSFGQSRGRGLTFVPRSVHKEKRTESSSARGSTT